MTPAARLGLTLAQLLFPIIGLGQSLAQEEKGIAVPPPPTIAAASPPRSVSAGTPRGTADRLATSTGQAELARARTASSTSASTVAQVQRLSDAGELQKFRLVHFATHGALAGQVGGSSEPGLILTPPATPIETDDGYLSTSKIAGLKPDADWVILSACNTAAGGSKDAEALSGLARAFFYAGTRALLVSHWSVNSEATVKLITGAIRRISADRSVGRAEALRKGMLTLIDEGSDTAAHPSTWAPFVVVGEGAPM